LSKFIIEDELHAESQGEFSDMTQAIAELKRRAELPWDQDPNLAPCTNWQACGRIYEVVEYDDSQNPWKELSRARALEVGPSGPKWAPNFVARWVSH
jgi:hypothetical protein